MELLSCVSLSEFIVGVMLRSAGAVGIIGISIAAFVAAIAIISRHSS